MHETGYVSMVQAAVAMMQRVPPSSPVPLTPMVQQARGTASEALKDPATCDTRLSVGSYAAARRAAGAVVRAIDEVLDGHCRNALCVVRPPGHHAGARGLIPGSVSCGFCVFNSIMVGAAHALSRRAAEAEAGRHASSSAAPLRVALVDFDVHHGDGSEEIVRKLLGSGLPPTALFFASIHLYDAGDASFGAFYPGSGGADDMAANIINVPVAPLWRRGALAGKGGGRGVGGGGGGAASPKDCACWGCGRGEWRAAFSQRIVPALRAFGPDLLLLSSGFDGGCGDIGNSKLDGKDKYHQGLDLSAADFEWATEQLLAVAQVCCPGRVVSVLEGGYGTFEPTKATSSGWAVSRRQLAENVGAHLSALCGVNGRG